MVTIKPVIKTFIIAVLIIAVFNSVTWGSAPRELFTRASNQYWSQNYSRAEELYQQFADSYSDHELAPDAWFGLAQALYRQEKYDEAGVWFGRVRREHSDSEIRGDAFFGEIEVALLNDERVRSRKMLETFLSLYPDHALAGSARERFEMLQPEEPVRPPEEPDEPQPEEEFVLEPDFEIDFPSELPPLRLTPDTTQLETRQPRRPDTAVRELRDVPRDRQEAALVSDLQKQVEELREENRRILRELRRQEEENRRFIKSATEYRDRFEEQKQLAEEHKLKSERLEEELSRRIRGLLSDTRIYELAHDIELSDTAEQALEEGVDYFRQRVDRALEMGEYRVAWNNIQKVLERSPGPEDYYTAAHIEFQIEGPVENVFRNLRTAIERADEIPARYLLLRAEVLLASDREREFDRFFSNWADEIVEKASPVEKSRWNLLVGQRYLRQGNRDEAFFRLMESVKSAPDSDFAARAREIIEKEM